MALLDRIVGWVGDVNTPLPEGEEKIAIHAFQAALAEWQDGGVTRADVVAAFTITVEEESDLDWLKGRYASASDKNRFAKVVDNVLLLAEAGRIYTTKASITARLNAAAV